MGTTTAVTTTTTTTNQPNQNERHTAKCHRGIIRRQVDCKLFHAFGCRVQDVVLEKGGVRRFWRQILDFQTSSLIQALEYQPRQLKVKNKCNKNKQSKTKTDKSPLSSYNEGAVAFQRVAGRGNNAKQQRHVIRIHKGREFLSDNRT
jgi:hypothetical protein